MMDLKEKEWFIKAPWGKMALIAWGDCFDEPVLMCHGSLDSAATFRPLVAHLPRNFYYIAIDLPGNGRSDPFPPGLMVNMYDLVYALKVVADHFRWEKFLFVSHSIGALLGRLFNVSYPGLMQRVVELDPAPLYVTTEVEEFAAWYHRFYTQFYNKYDTYNAGKESAPSYTREQAREMLKRNRGLDDAAADVVLHRITDLVGEDSVRFSYDQRLKLVTHPPFTIEQKQHLYTNILTPTLAVVASLTVRLGFYDKAKFALDESTYPAGNYRVRKVAGNHDVHLMDPKAVAGYVAQFLLYGLEGLDSKAKL